MPAAHRSSSAARFCTTHKGGLKGAIPPSTTGEHSNRPAPGPLHSRIELESLLVDIGHFTSYQPLGVYRAEQELLLHSELRDGNVNAGTDILRVMVEVLEWLPSDVQHVRVRSDNAAYQWSCLF